MTQYMEAVNVNLLLRRPELVESTLLPVLHSYDARYGRHQVYLEVARQTPRIL